MPLEFGNYLQPCGVSNFYAAMATNGSVNFNDIDTAIAVKNKNTFKLPLKNDDDQRNQPHLVNGNVQNNHLSLKNDLKNGSGGLGENGLSKNDVFLGSNRSNVDQSSVASSETDENLGRGRVQKQRKLGRSEHFNESLLDVYGNQSKLWTDFAAKTDVTSSANHKVTPTGRSSITPGYGRPLTPAMRQHSLPARISSRNETITPDANPRRRHHSVKFADELGKLLSTCVLIPSRYDDTERINGGAPHLLDDSDDSDLETFFTSPFKLNGGSSRGESNNLARRNEFNRVKRSGDLSQLQLPFRLCFDPPVSDYDLFLSKLQTLNVCLEKVKLELIDVRGKSSADQKPSTEQPALREMAQCVVRVANISFNKKVFARCTTNEWQSYTDLDAEYVDPGTGGFSVAYDTFLFSLAKPPGSGCCVSPSGRPGEAASRPGGAIEFSICFEANGVSHWDNNSGRNYRIVWS